MFGKRQDPSGEYAAVIPKWISARLDGRDIEINGDGSTTRDFCFVDNVVQANLLSAITGEQNKDQVYNVGLGEQTSLNKLIEYIDEILLNKGVSGPSNVINKEFRSGDVMHSLADIKKIKKHIGLKPEISFYAALMTTISWYIQHRGEFPYD